MLLLAIITLTGCNLSDSLTRTAMDSAQPGQSIVSLWEKLLSLEEETDNNASTASQAICLQHSVNCSWEDYFAFYARLLDEIPDQMLTAHWFRKECTQRCGHSNADCTPAMIRSGLKEAMRREINDRELAKQYLTAGYILPNVMIPYQTKVKIFTATLDGSETQVVNKYIVQFTTKLNKVLQEMISLSKEVEQKICKQLVNQLSKEIAEARSSTTNAEKLKKMAEKNAQDVKKYRQLQLLRSKMLEKAASQSSVL